MPVFGKKTSKPELAKKGSVDDRMKGQAAAREAEKAQLARQATADAMQEAAAAVVMQRAVKSHNASSTAETKAKRELEEQQATRHSAPNLHTLRPPPSAPALCPNTLRLQLCMPPALPSAPRPHPRLLAELRADRNPNPNPNPNPDQLAELRDFELSSFDIKRVRRPYSYGVTAGLGSGLAWTSRGCAAAVASPSCGGRRTSSLQRHRNLARYWYFT